MRSVFARPPVFRPPTGSHWFAALVKASQWVGLGPLTTPNALAACIAERDDPCRKGNGQINADLSPGYARPLFSKSK